ncbi:MAG TPA: hypothetical protein VJ044_18965, partial [Candidatus Hodarchaeales archaeon]|nr:hypothetical protein [Candidatus Hodarchaeales archaeon]
PDRSRRLTMRPKIPTSQETKEAVDRIYGRLMPRIRREAERRVFWNWVGTCVTCFVASLLLAGIIWFIWQVYR